MTFINLSVIDLKSYWNQSASFKGNHCEDWKWKLWVRAFLSGRTRLRAPSWKLGFHEAYASFGNWWVHRPVFNNNVSKYLPWNSWRNVFCPLGMHPSLIHGVHCKLHVLDVIVNICYWFFGPFKIKEMLKVEWELIKFERKLPVIIW